MRLCFGYQSECLDWHRRVRPRETSQRPKNCLPAQRVAPLCQKAPEDDQRGVEQRASISRAVAIDSVRFFNEGIG